MIGLIKGTARQVKTVSGLPLPIASYKSNSKAPLKELSLSINPTQSGSGDPAPDNIRPITGVSSVNVYRTGKNLYNIKNQTKTANNTYYKMYLPSNLDITFSTNVVQRGLYAEYNDNGNWVDFAQKYHTQTLTFNTGNHNYIRLMTFNVGTQPTEFQAELGSSATDYEAYTGNTYTIALGDTYYGATLDVVRGKLAVTWKIADLGSLTWDYIAPTSGIPYGAFYTSMWSKEIGDTNLICSNYPTKDYFNVDKSVVGNSGANTVYVIDSSYGSDVNAFSTAMSGVMLCYELATHIEIDLTPTQINSLLGQNNIWHDGNGDVEVLKFMDRQLYFGR